MKDGPRRPPISLPAFSTDAPNRTQSAIPNRRAAAAGQGRRRLRVQEHANRRGSRADSLAAASLPSSTTSSRHEQDHLAAAIARSCNRAGSRGRFFTTVDLANQLEARRALPGRLTLRTTPPPEPPAGSA